MSDMPTSEQWIEHVSGFSNFSYFARSIAQAWMDPHTGGILFQKDNWGGFWELMGSDSKVQFLPPNAKRIIRDGKFVFEDDRETVSEAWRSYQRRKLTEEAKKNYRPTGFYGSEDYRKLRERLREAGLA